MTLVTTVSSVPFVPLMDLRDADLPQAGGKAVNCARLKRAGFEVPDGLVVLATATDQDVQALSGHPWLVHHPPEARFAVRSSGVGEDEAGHSFAGLHETQLDVPSAGVPRAVADVRASTRSAQAIAYRRAIGLPTATIRTAVLVQLMVRPVAAGVAFTRNPVTGSDDELVVNSSWGLGEALVAGQITPDEFRISKRDGGVLSARAGVAGERTQLSLNPTQVSELGGILQSIERHYGVPQDVEWCHDGSRFWIVQSRPITAAGKARGTEWTRANLAEVLPDLTSPQALAAFEDMLNEGQRRFMGTLMAPEEADGPMFKSFNGRMYFNLTQLKHISSMAGTPPAQMMKSLGHPGEIKDEDYVPTPLTLRQRVRALPTLLKVMWRHFTAERLLREHDSTVAAFYSRVATVDPGTLTDEQIWSVMEEWQRRAPDDIQIVLTFGGVLFYEEQLRAVCRRAGVDADQFLFTQLATGERSVSAQQAYDLTDLAALARSEPLVREQLAREPLEIDRFRAALQGTPFLAAFDRFLGAYGHRGLYESDWALPRFREDPVPLLLAIRGHLSAANGPDRDRRAQQPEQAAAGWRAFERRLTRVQRWTLLPYARRLVKRINQYYVWREHCRFEMVRVLFALRRWHLVLARRFVERGLIETPDQYFLVLMAEVGQVIGRTLGRDALRTLVAKRASDMDRFRRISMPLLMRESELPALIRLAGVSGTDGESELRGITTSPGCVEADVAVILDPGDFAAMKRGAILVTRATDPSWTPLFTLAAGVIVEVGGLLSHASTVAREYGLPALANVAEATRRLRSGDRVVLNATEGFVRRLERGQNGGPA